MQSIDQWTNRYAFISGTPCTPWHKDRQRWRDRRASGNCKNTCKYDVLQRNMQIKQAVGGWPPRYAPAQACKWWHDIRHVRIWIGRNYCMSMPVQPTKAAWWPWSLTFWPWKWCPTDVWRGLPCANFGLPRPLCSQVTPNVRDRQTSDKSIA